MVKYSTIWRAVSIRIKNNEMKLQEYEGTGMREENVRLINLLASMAAVTKKPVVQSSSVNGSYNLKYFWTISLSLPFSFSLFLFLSISLSFNSRLQLIKFCIDTVSLVDVIHAWKYRFRSFENVAVFFVHKLN